MVSVCLYFQVHQPMRLGKYTIFDIGHRSDYFDESKNREIIHKVARKCYLPANALLVKLIGAHRGRFKVSFSVTGVVLDQFEQYAPWALESFKKLAQTGGVEFLGETSHHSLAYLYSKPEFEAQVRLHDARVRALFGQAPRVFRNTELIYNNALAADAEAMGYEGILAEGADHVLGWRSPNFVYAPLGCARLKLLLKNYRLSDDIAFRFGNKGWAGHPLTADKFAKWVSASNGCGDVVNLFMDYETFGEHQWEDTGIFAFLEHLPGELLAHPDNRFVTVSEALAHEARGPLDIHHFVSWADIERDLSAWLGNPIQEAASRELYRIEPLVKAAQDPKLLEDWRRLTTSDHFYYMCTKWFNDGDVHKYFNPYDSPYDAFIIFLNVLNDIVRRAGGPPTYAAALAGAVTDQFSVQQ